MESPVIQTQATATQPSKVVHLNVNDQVIMTGDDLHRLKHNCHSVANRTMRLDYWKEFEGIVANKLNGVITHTFKPSYDVTVRFGDKSFHISTYYLTTTGRKYLMPSSRRKAKLAQIMDPTLTIRRYDKGKYQSQFAKDEPVAVILSCEAIWAEQRSDKHGKYYALYCLSTR